jgi:hypothetical protein
MSNHTPLPTQLETMERLFHSARRHDNRLHSRRAKRFGLRQCRDRAPVED